jgi:uncharacterized protein YgiM (DUF1202 family)
MKLNTPYDKIYTVISKMTIFIRGDFLKKIFSFALAILLSVSLFAAMPKVQATTKPIGAGRVTTASTSLNVRSSPSTSASVKARLKRNAYVTLIKKSGSFWYVRYGESSYGYCHQDYITQTSTKVRQVKTSSGRLNVRSGASTSHTITDYLESGRYVTVLSEADNNFAKIIYKGSKTGYVHTKYLVTPSTTETKYKQ